MPPAIKRGGLRQKRGPKPDHLHLEGDWQDAVGKAVQKPRPVSGWPAKPKRAPKGKK